MGAIKVIRSEDGKPFVSLEDFIEAIETLKDTPSIEDYNPSEIVELVLKVMHDMEQEYYTKFYTHTDKTNPHGTDETNPVPEKNIQEINDLEADLVKKILHHLKVSKRKLNKEQSKIADEIDRIAGAHLIVQECDTPENLDRLREKMAGIRTICSHAFITYDYWTLLIEAVKKNSMTYDDILEMLQQRIQNGQSKKSK